MLLGDSGTGMTHRLIGLCTAAADAGRPVRYVTTVALVNELVEAAADDRQLARVVGRYARLDLLRLEELGYVHLDPRGAKLLFRIITAREEGLHRLRQQSPVLRVGPHLHRSPPPRRRCRPAHHLRPHHRHRSTVR